jgi:hypothetical protein
MNVFDVIADQRPPRKGWATGSYTCQCCDCNEFFLGDKRAWMCSNCAWNGIALKKKQVVIADGFKDFTAKIENLIKEGYHNTYDGVMICCLSKNGENIEVVLKSGEPA